MANELRLTLPMPVSDNALRRATSVGKFVRVYKTKKAVQSQKLIAMVALAARNKAGWVLDGSNIGMRLIAYLPRKNCDLVNRHKAFADALIGVLWLDDLQIKMCEQWWAVDTKNPRLEVLVWKMPNPITLPSL